MYGIFNCQFVVGQYVIQQVYYECKKRFERDENIRSTDLHEIEGTYQLLTMPSLFEMGFNYARWYYKTDR